MTPARPEIGLRTLAVAGAILAAALLPHAALAALGEPEATVTDDAQQLEASIKSTQRTNYRMHEIVLPSGTVLREYAAVGGTVFAVTWAGPSMPNLRQVLAQYFDTYVNAAKTNRTGRSHLQIQQGDLVVQSSGHMRAFTGRAYLAHALPAGTTVAELR